MTRQTFRTEFNQCCAPDKRGHDSVEKFRERTRGFMNDAAQRTDKRDRFGAIGVRRASAIPEARRHSTRVLRLRRWILWCCATILGVVVIGIALQSFRFLPVDWRLARIGLNGSRIIIESPKLVGYRKDGRPYELRARQGVQDMAAPNIFELEMLEVRVENDNGAVTVLSAAKGVYDSKRNYADLTGGVRIYDDNRYDMRFESAAMDFHANIMTSDRPVTLTLEQAEVAAQSVELAQIERRATFTGAVHSVFRGEDDDASAAQPAQP